MIGKTYGYTIWDAATKSSGQFAAYWTINGVSPIMKK